MSKSFRRSVLPETAESICCKLGVAACMLDVPVAEVVLHCPRIVPIVRQFEAATMAKHMGVHRKWQSGLPAGSSDQLSRRGIRQRPTTLRDKHVWSITVVTLEAS